MIYEEEMSFIEKISFDDLEEEDKKTILETRNEYENKNTISHSELLKIIN